MTSRVNVVVLLEIGAGTFAQGFPVTLGILEEGRLIKQERHCPSIPADSPIPHLYQQWQQQYTILGQSRHRFRKLQPLAEQTTHQSIIEGCRAATEDLRSRVRDWFCHESFQSLRDRILAQAEVQRDAPIAIVIDAHTGDEQQDLLIKKLPWTLWDLFNELRQAEVVLNAGFQRPIAPLRSPVRLLAILGSSEGGLDLEQDQAQLEQLHRTGAKITVLEQPTRGALHHALCNQRWDILFFAGHSFSAPHYQTGHIQITDGRSLALDDLEEDLRIAVKQGLKLAIFNSCDGLGISTYLSHLQIPSTIVMREPIPDVIAREFLRHFLHAFTSGKPLSLAVREARRRLQWWESAEIPCPAASWLPIICQNPNQTQLRMKRHHPPPILYILLLLGLATAVYGLWQRAPANPSHLLLSDSPAKPRFADVDVPDPEERPAFKFAGSTASAAMLCADGDTPGDSGIHSQIQRVHPQFKLEYVSPAAGVPSSGKGLQLLLNHQVDFVLSSRLPKLEEEQAREQTFELRSIPIARYATAYSVHPQVGIGAIGGLTLDDLRRIFTSDTPLNWQDFGGAPQRITPYVHEAEKGALYIGERLFGEFSSTAKYVQTTTLAMQAIARDYGGIYRSPSVLTFGQKTVTTMPILNTQGEASLPFTDPTFNPTEACKRLSGDANPPAPINPDYPSELQEPLYVIFKDYPGHANLQERAGRAYAELLRTDQGREMLNAIGFQPVGNPP